MSYIDPTPRLPQRFSSARTRVAFISCDQKRTGNLLTLRRCERRRFRRLGVALYSRYVPFPDCMTDLQPFIKCCAVRIVCESVRRLESFVRFIRCPRRAIVTSASPAKVGLLWHCRLRGSLDFSPRQQNLWVDSGSGSRPSV